MDPKVYLAIDNCFASKRWVRPAEWMRVIRDLGLTYVEASADTECDPLYMGPDFTKTWLEDVKAESAKTGIVVKNLYSGHGTYATCGLSHYDRRVTERFRDQWMKAQTDTANELGAGFGFFAHGFEELLLQDDALYEAKLEELTGDLTDLAVYAKQTGMEYICIEQMYSPHQPPWTIEGTRKMLSDIWQRGNAPFYITADLGHMNGQQYFLKPDAAYIARAISVAQQGEPIRRLWLGTAAAHALYKQAVRGEIAAEEAVQRILEDVEAHPNLFARPVDATIDGWMRELGCYSSIVHLQQTDGKSSPHWPFSESFNKKGIVEARAVMNALAASYAQPDDPAMPPKSGEVVMTLEPFIGTAGNTFDLLDDLVISIGYWRQFIPEDGMRLSEIMARL